jgi:membrane fusion protein
MISTVALRFGVTKPHHRAFSDGDGIIDIAQRMRKGLLQTAPYLRSYLIGEFSNFRLRQRVPAAYLVPMTLFRPEVEEYRKTRLHGEVVLTQPLSTRLMTGAIFLVIAIAGTWVWFGSYARTEIVPGILSTDIPTAKVQALSAGVVTELHAVEGQLVERGQRLAVINLDRQTQAGGNVARRSLDAVTSRSSLARRQAELALQRAQAERRRLETVIASATEQQTNLTDQIALQEQVVASNQRLFDQISTVVDRGFVSRVEFERRRQTLLNSQQGLASLRQQLTSRQAEAAQARAQIATISIDAAQGQVEAETSLAGIAQQQAELEGATGYVVTAPIAGRITALQTAQGRVANPAVPLMIIVPEGARLKAELFAPTRAIGFVESGQETRLLLDAFPYQRFGSFGGRIESVSRTIIDPRETDVPLPLEEAVYRVTVTLDETATRELSERLRAQPGMTLQGNIILERRSFLDWLLQPLSAVLNRTT